MPPTDNARLVPLASVTAQEFEAFADESKWVLAQENPATDFTPHEKIWQANPDASVYWVENELFGFNYIIVAGPDYQAVAETVSQHIAHYDAARVETEWKAAGDDTDRLVLLIKIAAYAADPHVSDPAILKLFEAAFVHLEVGVRRVAMISTAALSWKEFQPWYEKLENDPDVMLQAMAKQALGKQETSYDPVLNQSLE